MFNIHQRISEWANRKWEQTAHVEATNELPPATDGRQFRYEVMMRLSRQVGECPTEDEIREFAEGLLAEIESFDDSDAPDEWDGPDELYIQFYPPGTDTDAGACGTVHWLKNGGYETVAARPFLF